MSQHQKYVDDETESLVELDLGVRFDPEKMKIVKYKNQNH